MLSKPSMVFSYTVEGFFCMKNNATHLHLTGGLDFGAKSIPCLLQIQVKSFPILASNL